MGAFSGTWQLIRLALRRDRIKLPIWIIAIVGLLSSAVPTLKGVYGGSQDAITQYVGTMSHSKVALLFGGPVDGPYFGSIVMLEYFLFIAVMFIFMSFLTVIRHTRQNEETGRSELIGSAPVGRHAQLASALIVAVGACVVTALLITPGLMATTELSTDGVIAMVAALAGTGITFAAIAAVAAQLVGTARGASALVGGVLGVGIVLRGLGDALGDVTQGGLGTSSTWLSWLSPIGWGQQMSPFGELHWQALWLYAVSFVGLTMVAFWLSRHRDYGMGMIAAQLGRAHARASLLSPLGLAWRLQRVLLISWGISVVFLGAILGITAVEMKDFFTENQEVAQVLGSLGGGELTDVYFSAMMAMMALVVAGYALMATLKLRSEEASGVLESVLATAVGRSRWMLSHLGIVIVCTVLLATLGGLSTGVAYALTLGDAWSQVGPLTVAGLVQVPAILVFVGLTVAVFGLLSRWSQTFVWAAFTLCLAVSMLGDVLKLPEWAMKLSPFYHTPTAPAENIDLAPLVIMVAIALALMIVGFVAFRRRDLSIGD